MSQICLWDVAPGESENTYHWHANIDVYIAAAWIFQDSLQHLPAMEVYTMLLAIERLAYTPRETPNEDGDLHRSASRK